MYNLRFDSNITGKTLEMTLENNIVIGHVEGATGGTVSLGLAQGYQQIGQTVISTAVSGMSLTITGFIFDGDTKIKRTLLQIFAPFTTGRLWWNNEYFCDVVVQSYPTISQERHSRFSFRLYSETPYWSYKNLVSTINGITQPEFQFPVNYSTPHRFGTRDLSRDYSILNNGDVESPFDIQISGTEDVVNPKVLNLTTGESLLFNGTVAVGETLRLYQKSGKLRVVLTHTDGTETNEFAMLDDLSSFFTLEAGTNLLQSRADSGGNNMITAISFYPLYAGVLANGV